MSGQIKLHIEKLGGHHDVNAFDCGAKALNAFLQKHALTNQKSGSAQTYLALYGQTVVGFYSLTFGQVEYGGAPERLREGLPRYPVPILLLARLAVDTEWHGKGLGSGMLKDALFRTLHAADIAGIRAVVVHAKNDNARLFYENLGFASFDEDNLVLYRLIKDIRVMAESRQGEGDS